MATSVLKKGRKVPLDNNNRGRVGEFFEQLVKTTVGGDFNKLDDLRYGDIVDWDLRLGIEVKSSDNGHPFRIRIKQKRRYEEILFPLDHFAYCLCSYRNRVRARRVDEFLRTRGRKASMITLLHRYDKKFDQFRILSEKVDEVFLIDIEVMNALEQRQGIRSSSHVGHQEEFEFRLRRQDLRPLVNGSFRSLMRELGLDSNGWILGRYKVEVEISFLDHTASPKEMKFYPSFFLYTILRRPLHQRFVRTRQLAKRRIRNK